MKRHMVVKAVVAIAVSLGLCLTVGCAKTRKAGGQMDTPEVHYTQGMKYWDKGEIAKAEEEFKLAQSLDPKFAPAVAGLALTTAMNAKTATDTKSMEQGFKDANKLADKAKSLGGGKLASPFMAKAMVITLQNEGTKRDPKDWIRDVESEYKDALKIDPANAEAYYRRGVCYKKALMFSEAKADFAKVLELKKEWTNEADVEFKLINDIERAAPGTDIGKKIALVEKMTRADMAALFIAELKIDKLVEKKRPKTYETGFAAPADSREMAVDKNVKLRDVVDMDGHWAKNFVNDITSLKIRGLEPGPDHKFYPDQLVNRGEYAMMVEDAIIAITGDQTIASKHVGEAQSRFPDVNPSHPAYNAVCTAADRGIMDAEINGEFGMDKSVSGPEALLVIRKLRNFLKLD